MQPFLQIGDKVAITAPASKVSFEAVTEGLEVLKSWGLEIIVGNTVGDNYFNFSDTDQERLAEFQAFLDDPEIKLIIAARGGYGCSRILDQVIFDKFKENPKWICGFSDITIILQHLFILGFESIHGPMVKTMSFDAISNEYLRKVLFGEAINYEVEGNEFNRIGEATGQAIGGNLVLLTHSLGSKSEISYDHKILFIEDIGEYYYGIDRMLIQLKRAGKFNHLAGLVVGDFTDCKDNAEPFGKTIEEIVLDNLSEFNFPIIFNFPFGHDTQNFPIKVGEYITIKSSIDKAYIHSNIFL